MSVVSPNQDDLTLSRLGDFQLAQGLFLDAIGTFQDLIARNPNSRELRDRLGIAYSEQGWTQEAIDLFLQTLVLHPNSASTHYHLAHVWFDRNDLHQAECHYQRAVELDPGWAACLNDLGVVQRQLGKVDEALGNFHAAIIHAPNFTSARLNRGTTQLLLGNYDLGWPDYEWRRLTDQIPLAGLERPHWDGSDLAGRRILIRTEQAFGDVFQFIRYAEFLAMQGGTVLVQTRPEIMPILSGVNGIESLCVETTSVDWDVEALLLSLPRLTNTTLDTVPNTIPYLFADPQLVSHWQQRLATIAGIRIGIAWSGSPRTDIDHERSIPLDEFAALAKLAGVQLISLQKNFGDEEDKQLTEMGIHHFNDLDLAAGPFMDTAAIMLNLDLVISCDTSLAHLAGGLGVPVWVALARVPEWRFLLDREDSPWYPTMRLFRQASRGGWGPVFNDMAQQLAIDRGVTLPPGFRAQNPPQNLSSTTSTGKSRPCELVPDVEVVPDVSTLNELKACRHGLMLFNRFDEFIGRSLKEYGEFSEPELVLLRHWLGAGSVVVDIGANIGTHTVAFARYVGPNGRVIACEPQRIVYQLLTANIALNHFLNVETLHAAAAAQCGQLAVPEVNYSQAGNFGGVEFGNSTTTATFVPTITIDEFNLKQCQLIKIDAEGMEREILQGAEQTIRQFQPVIYVEDDRYEKSQSLVEILTRYGYTLYRHHPLLYQANNYFRNPVNVFGNLCSRNILGLPRSHAPLASDFITLNGLSKI